MKQLININVGLDKIAKIYVEREKDRDSGPEIYERCGTNNSIRLNKYKLKDGTMAYEFLQIIIDNKIGQKLYFLGLRTSKREFGWPPEKILNLLRQEFH
jgi:hypothetical protein